ncbi:T9SS type A sorting domain-containing protein [bacterium]|nr:T9SS type A sorting domain-containing protein [bacterium]
MRVRWSTMWVILGMLLVAMTAMADVSTPMHTVMLPDGRVISGDELDTEFTDSLFYFDPGDYSSLYTTANLWSAVRFTAPAAFTLQGVHFLPLNQYSNTTDGAEVYVYDDDAGSPGENMLTSGDPIGTVATVASFSDYNEVLLDEEDYIEFESGEEFWIIYGPAPGGNYPGQTGDGWWNLLDSGSSNERNKMAAGTTIEAVTDWGDPLQGDFFIVAGGEVESFFDLSLKAVYNDVQQFHVSSGTTINYHAKIKNTGNIDSPDDAELELDLVDSEGTSVWSETITLDAIAGGDSTVIDLTTPWTAGDVDRYVMTGTITATDDADPDNDVNYLLQQVVASPDWYIYDDGTFETGTNFSEGNGWAVAYKPSSVPANIDSASWYIAEDDDDVNLQVWSLVDETIEALWTYEGAVDAEWNALEVTDENGEAFNIADGFFVPMYVWTEGDNAFQRDINPPTSASNSEMPDASWQVSDGGSSWAFDNSGNWGMRARIGQGVAPSLSFPNTQLDFGQVTVGETGSAMLEIENSGDGAGRIDSITFAAGSAELSYVPTLPFVIEAGETAEFEFQWTPEEVDPDFSGGALVYHNDLTQSPPRVIVQFSGVAALNVEENAEAGIPNEYFLDQNFPNPFNPTTTIRFGLVQPSNVKVTVYNIEGRQVATLVSRSMNAGVHHVNFDATNLASGVYYYAIQANDFRSMKKMVLMK